MLLNRVERLMMNNPLRAFIQWQFEARRLERMGGRTPGARALEVGCGRGVGTEIILNVFGASQVDAFDLDPKMVALAQKRLAPYGSRVRLSSRDATALSIPDATFDAVFDFGIIHHVPDWQVAVAEIFRVLKPGGRFFAEEVLDRFIFHPIWLRLLNHPLENRFTHADFAAELEKQGFSLVAKEEMWGWFGWYVAEKRLGC